MFRKIKNQLKCHWCGKIIQKGKEPTKYSTCNNCCSVEYPEWRKNTIKGISRKGIPYNRPVLYLPIKTVI